MDFEGGEVGFSGVSCFGHVVGSFIVERGDLELRARVFGGFEWVSWVFEGLEAVIQVDDTCKLTLLSKGEVLLQKQPLAELDPKGPRPTNLFHTYLKGKIIRSGNVFKAKCKILHPP